MSEETQAQPVEEPEVALEAAAEAPAAPGEEPRLLVRQAALEAMREHGRSDTSRECGGVMLGESLQGASGPVVLVEATIIAEHAEARRGSVTFTHETWEHINQVKDAQYPDLKVVGWYHTHPGFGIFLSDYDLFIQQNFFDLPWNVAFVLDPLRGKAGAFGWKGGKVVQLERYEVLVRGAEEPPEEAPEAEEKPEPGEPAAAEAKVPAEARRVWWSVLWRGTLLGVAVVVVLAGIWWMAQGPGGK